MFQIKEFAEQSLIKDEITVILEYDIIPQDEVNVMDRYYGQMRDKYYIY